jgi:hypothetical protein
VEALPADAIAARIRGNHGPQSTNLLGRQLAALVCEISTPRSASAIAADLSELPILRWAYRLGLTYAAAN